ncbi:hypothetical protein BDR26DRAFT_354054 [Obelidium mucronatum]|nr:hypothetical protein BDR26DRAFT_354054 [Obelidium mucronatum]
MSTSCVILSAASACGPAFAGYPVDGSVFADEAAVDALVAAVLRPDAALFAEPKRGCAASPALTAAVASMRYQASFNCATIVNNALLAGCMPRIENPSFNSDRGSVVLCGNLCQLAISSYNNVYANNQCTPTDYVTQLLQNRNWACGNMTASLTTNKDQQCNLGVAPELNSCGFATAAQSKSYCASAASSGDLCCNFPTGVQFATLGSDGQYHLPDSTNNKSSSGPSIGVIVGAAVGGVALLAIIGAGVFMYMRKNKGSNSSRYQQEEPHPSQQQQQQQPQYQQQKSIPQQQQQQLPPQPPKQQGGEIMRIIHSYEPQLQDELALVEGDDLILLKRFDDGWAQGCNPLTGKQGAFPLVCVCSIHELHTSKPQSQKKHASADRISKLQQQVSQVVDRLGKRSSKRRFASCFRMRLRRKMNWIWLRGMI